LLGGFPAASRIRTPFRVSAPFVPAASQRGEHRHTAILQLSLATTAEGLQITVLAESGRVGHGQGGKKHDYTPKPVLF
jgi:hypothetical protein